MNKTTNAVATEEVSMDKATALAVADMFPTTETMEQQLSAPNDMYCTMEVKTQEDRMALFNIMNSPDEKLAEHINEIISLRHIFTEMVDVTNEETGELEKAPRIVLIDENGKSYSCVSRGILGALKKLFQCFGMPTVWTAPLKIKVLQQQGKGTNKFLTIMAVK